MADHDPFDELPELPESAPGEQTRAVIMNAGIHRQARTNRRVAAGIVFALTLIGAIIGLDAAGILQLLPEDVVPTIGETTSAPEPPTPASPHDPSALRDELLGANDAPAAAPKPPPAAEAKPADALSARALFEDEAKKPATLNLDTRAVRAQVALPDGLTGEAIAKVIEDNRGGARLCIAEAMRAGETKGGKAEFDVTIVPDGSVSDVSTRASAGTQLGACMEKTIQRWRFPSFEGEPVVVVIPYVITPGI